MISQFCVLKKKEIIIESILILLFLFLILQNLNSYSIIMEVHDPDPDGYISHAKTLYESGVSPEGHRRLPGGPLFISMSNRIIGKGFFLSPIIIQKILFFIVISVCFFIVKKRNGSLVGLLFLSVFVVNNLYARSVSWLYPDFLYSIFALAIFLCINKVLFLEGKINKNQVIFILLLLGALFICSTLRPNALFFLFSILFSSIFVKIYNNFKEKKSFISIFRGKYFKKLSLIIIISIFVSRFVGNYLTPSGVSPFLENHLAINVVSATSSQWYHDFYEEEDIEFVSSIKVEQAKNDIKNDAGVDISRLRFSSKAYKDQWDYWTDGAPLKLEDAKNIYRDRMVFCVHQLLHSGMIEFFRMYNIVFSNFYIYFPYLGDLTSSESPSTKGVLVNKIYKATGIFTESKVDGSVLEQIIKIVVSVTKFLCFLILIFVGTKHVASKNLNFAACFLVSMFVNIAFVSIFVIFDSRYILPYALGIYFIQVIGLYKIIIYVSRLLLDSSLFKGPLAQKYIELNNPRDNRTLGNNPGT